MFYFSDDNTVTVYFSNGDIAIWKKDTGAYDSVLEMCKNKEWIKIETMFRINKMIMTNNTTIDKNNNIVVNNTVIEEDTNSLTRLIATLKKKGVVDTDIEKVKPFLMNCIQNEYIDAIHELYEYCKAMDFEITEDGCFLAYKNVNEDYTSVYDNKTKHTIGKITTVDTFDTSRTNTCSMGLHFCSKSYLSSYGGAKTIIVKINPKDVVAIPIDYNNTKGRCKQYVMVGEISKNADFSTTDLNVATNETIIKTDNAKKVQKKLAKHKDKYGSRIQETADNMHIYNNNKEKVAKVMNITISTVERNMRKYRKK
jgi:transcriptional regulator with PAS, ATPase and Fis domain